MKHQYTTSPSGRWYQPRIPDEKPILFNPSMTLWNIYKAWKRCQEMQGNKFSNEAIGYIFFLAMSDLFEEFQIAKEKEPEGSSSTSRTARVKERR